MCRWSSLSIGMYHHLYCCHGARSYLNPSLPPFRGEISPVLLERRAEVPISPESIKPSSAKSRFIFLSFIFSLPFPFYCPVNEFSFL